MAHANPYTPGQVETLEQAQNELVKLADTVKQIIDNQKLVQRDDGCLMDCVVVPHTLSDEVVGMIGHFELVGAYAARPYQKGQVVTYQERMYVCAAAHHGGAVMDMAQWRLLGKAGCNDLQKLMDNKLLWFKQNAILPYDSDTDYPVGAVTLKGGKFQKWDGAEWADFIKLEDSHLQQLTDNKLLWLKQNAILPYDSDTDYPVGTVTLKDGKFQKWDGIEWSDFIEPEDSQITTWSGRTQEQKNRDFVTDKDYGAIGDGTYHPLSEKYATLALAKSAYSNIANRITSLTQSIDWAAIQSALQANNTVYALAKRYVLTDTILVPDGHSLKGQGVDYWDSYRPNPTDLQKSDSNGTHFYFYGQGAKVHYIDDIANTLPPKSKDGVSYELTHFTNRDATATTSATPRMFSVGIKVGKNSNLEGCRAIPYYNGLQGYIDGTGLSDEWDVGVWVVSANDCQVDNVQAVGHWRMCGVLVTEHQDKSEGKRNPERCNFNRVWGSGVRGLIARNTPQYECTAYTSSTLTLNVNNTETISSVGKFRTSSGGTDYTFTGFTKSGGTLTLTGVSPALTALPSTVRAWNVGNNFSNTVFQNCIFSSLDHVSGQPAESFGLPVSGAAEFDGYPMRNLVFINTAFQTTFDKLNTIWGNCYDFKYIGCKHENGQKIAYSDSETKMFTMNLRMIAQDVATEGWELFTPRSGFNDALQMPMTFTNGSLTLKPLPSKQIRIEDSSGSAFLESLANGARRVTFDDYMDIRKNGVTASGLTLTEAGTRVKNVLTTDSTATFGGTIRPLLDNASSLGTSAFRWSTVYAGTGAISTSDERLKQQFRSQSESEKSAAMEIKNSICMYKFNGAVDLKGDGARWHCGVKAQEVVSILESHGLNWQEYAFVCFDEWGEQAEIVDEEGVITQEHREAGSRYAIRYDELSMFILSSI